MPASAWTPRRAKTDAGAGRERIGDAHEALADEAHREGAPRVRQRRVRRRRPARTTASTSSSRDGGSRNGPAGSMQPVAERRARVDDGDLDVARQP